MDAGSVPVGYLVMESNQTSLGRMGDLAQNIIRPLVQKYVPGTVAISPFGPNMRSILININPDKLQQYNLNPQHVIDALAMGNTVVPAGNLYIKDSMPMVANNATVTDIQRLGSIPLRMQENVYLRDVANFQDDTDITYGYALVNGKKSVYLPIIKKDTSSTLIVVADIRKVEMDLFREAVNSTMRERRQQRLAEQKSSPGDTRQEAATRRTFTINFEFDESPTRSWRGGPELHVASRADSSAGDLDGA